MPKYKLVILFSTLQLLIIAAELQSQETVPMYHWAYSYIDQLQLRGHLKGLNSIQKPYTRTEVYQSLVQLTENAANGLIKLSTQERWLLEYLNQEFVKAHEDKSEDMNIRLGVWADESLRFRENENKSIALLRSQVGLQFRDHFYFYNGMLLDQLLYNDPEYTGNKWRGFAGYAEQAYLRYANSFLQITFGRDFLYWGSGKTGRLLFSDNARPLDMFAVTLKYKAISLTSMAANLDQWSLADSLALRYQVGTANRYLSVHRMTFTLWNKLHVGFTEALLYGGPHSTWELKYHNPLLYYHGELLNRGGFDGNGLLYFDFDWYPWKNWEFYGELLVDDLQVEKTVPGDLEPNEIAFIFGFQKSELPGIKGITVGAEYVKVANRTYNSSLDWEKFVHYKRPIGYYMGNNFDRWHFSTEYWFPRKCRMGIAFDYIRKGEGSVLDQWDEPWQSFTVTQGYDEPFPYGIVESSFVTNFYFRWHFKSNFFVDCSFRCQEIENSSNEVGLNISNWESNIRLHWNVNSFFDY